MPIDFVVTWIDGADREWQTTKRLAAQGSAAFSADANSEARFRDWGLLKYWFRAVEDYCPWVGTIFLVTPTRLPAWLDISNPRLRVITDGDIVPDAYRPTFSSHAVEANLDRISGLSERFVYFNDDMFIAKPLTPEFFFPRGLPYGLAVPHALWSGDSHAHALLNTSGQINEHFSKNDVLRQHWKKFFSLRYGADLYRCIALLPERWLLPFLDPHLPVPLLRSNLVEAFERCSASIDRASASVFRSSDDVAPVNLAASWALATGRFSPVRRKSLGRFITLGRDSEAEIRRVIASQDFGLFCLNDGVVGSDEALHSRVLSAFENKHPAPSSFEM